jgi:hypothetical protein
VISHPAKYGSHPAIKFADTNVGGGEGFATYPQYALGFLRLDPPDLVLPAVDVPNLPV